MTMLLSVPQTFGSLVRERRSELNLSQQALADIIGVTQSTVARWELDQTFPKPPELSPLATALEIPLESLLAPLEEEEARQPSGTTREQLQAVNERLERLEKNLEMALKLLRRRPK